MFVKMIAVLDHTFLRIEVVALFVKKDNGKARKTNPTAKTVMLVNTTTMMEVNQNPIARFVNLQPTTTKLDKHLVKVIALPVRTLISIKLHVPFVIKDNTKTRMNNQIVKLAQRGNSMDKLDEPS